jgi:hypothetical protein
MPDPPDANLSRGAAAFTGDGALAVERAFAQAKLPWAEQWLTIAAEHLDRASVVRTRMEQGGDPACLVMEEFREAVVCITACTHAIEGERNRIGLSELPSNPKDKNAGARLALRLRDADLIGIRDPLNEDLPWLFELRNASVHPKEEWTPSARHPVGVNINPGTLAHYTVEAATRAISTTQRFVAVTAARPDVANPLTPPWLAE